MSDVDRIAERLAVLRCQDVHALDAGYATACHACKGWGKYAAERLAPLLAEVRREVPHPCTGDGCGYCGFRDMLANTGEPAVPDSWEALAKRAAAEFGGVVLTAEEYAEVRREGQAEGRRDERQEWSIRWADGTMMGPAYGDAAEATLRGVAPAGAQIVTRTVTTFTTDWRVVPVSHADTEEGT